MIELNNFKFYYGEKNILNIKHLCLDTSKISILMGPNGSGKSTLLRVLKFLEGDFDNITYFGCKNLNSDQKRQLYLLFPEPIFLNRSIEKNFSFLSKIYRLAQAKEHLNEALRLLDVDTILLKKYPNELSSGQGQKIAFALALSIRARYYLLDEPSAFLDKNTLELFKKAILYMQKTYGSGFLIASHDKHFLDSLAQKKYYLHSGEILEFENTNIFELKNGAVKFHDFIDFSLCKNYICKNEIPSKIAINPYKISLLDHPLKDGFILRKCSIIALRIRKDFVLIRVSCADKILEFALACNDFQSKNLQLYQELSLIFNEDAICFLN